MAQEFYFNTRTHAVEEGRHSDWQDLMGPYPSRDAAEHALEAAARRTAAWDEQDRRDRE